jgi:hypothetical protein
MLAEGYRNQMETDPAYCVFGNLRNAIKERMNKHGLDLDGVPGGRTVGGNSDQYCPFGEIAP